MTTTLTLPDAGAIPDGESAGPEGGAVRFVVQVLAWMVIIATLGVLAAAVLVPRLAGATPFTVLTGSMAPTYPPGTLIVDQKVDAADIHIGDPVTFQIASGRPEVVTHRVVAIRPDADGNLEFLTKGDANDVNDPDWRPSEAIRGRVWYAVPHLGRVNALLTGHQRQLAVYGVAAGLVIYAGAMLGSAGRDRRRSTLARPAHRA